MMATEATRRFVERERAAQRALMAAKRAVGRDIEIPAVRNPRRRRQCEKDRCLWLRTYLPKWFSNPFTKNQRGMVRQFMERIEYGGWKAYADDRGGGKTTIIKGCSIIAILEGLAPFLVVVAANGPRASLIRRDVTLQFERNPLLAQDYPEVCVPIRALEGASQRARSQTVGGERTWMEWSGDKPEVVFPTITGSRASGVIFAAVGIDGSIRGLSYQGQRPTFVVLDDPETRESSQSEVETARREATIDSDLAGLGPPDRRLGMVYLCTIWSSISLALKYTDPKIKPAWDGERHKLLETPPDRMDLWEKYMEMRQAGVLEGDVNGRAAHRFYLSNRDTMDAGAVVANPYRFDGSSLPDGTQKEISTLQFCFNTIADVGWEHFNTEHQNVPPAAQEPEIIDLDVPLVMKRCNGRGRGLVRQEADYLTAGIDVGARAVHWAVFDWRHAQGAVVDYGVIPVHSPLEVNVEDPDQVDAVQQAIFRALADFHDQARAGWAEEDTGEERFLDLALFDVGYARSSMDEPVWALLAEVSGKAYQASKGFGSRPGQSPYTQPRRGGRGKRVFNHAFATYQARRHAWLYSVDADYWKLFVQQGLTTPTDRPGNITLFGSDPLEHRQFARHLTAERWEPRHTPGRGTKWIWRQHRKKNHWLDCAALACAAAGILGVKTVGRDPAAAVTEKRERKQAKSVAGRGGRRISRIARFR